MNKTTFTLKNKIKTNYNPKQYKKARSKNTSVRKEKKKNDRKNYTTGTSREIRT